MTPTDLRDDQQQLLGTLVRASREANAVNFSGVLTMGGPQPLQIDPAGGRSAPVDAAWQPEDLEAFERAGLITLRSPSYGECYGTLLRAAFDAADRDFAPPDPALVPVDLRPDHLVQMRRLLDLAEQKDAYEFVASHAGSLGKFVMMFPEPTGGYRSTGLTMSRATLMALAHADMIDLHATGGNGEGYEGSIPQSALDAAANGFRRPADQAGRGGSRQTHYAVNVNGTGNNFQFGGRGNTQASRVAVQDGTAADEAIAELFRQLDRLPPDAREEAAEHVQDLHDEASKAEPRRSRLTASLSRLAQLGSGVASFAANLATIAGALGLKPPT